MPEGFGQLAALQKLDMGNCTKIQFLPESKLHCSESFYFLIFDARRVWRSAAHRSGSELLRVPGPSGDLAADHREVLGPDQACLAWLEDHRPH